VGENVQADREAGADCRPTGLPAEGVAANPFASAWLTRVGEVGREPMDDLLQFLLFFGGWIVLQRWILPKAGVPS
jgi:hypothetical protein